MKRNTSFPGYITAIGLAMVWSIVTALPLRADTPAIGSYTFSISTSANGPTMIGWKFTVENPITVTALGICTDVPFVAGPTSAQVGLWKGSGTKLASCTVLSGDVVDGSFTYHTITSVILQPGQSYTVACLLPTGAGWISQVDDPGFAPGIDFVARRFDFSPSSTLFMPTVDYNSVPLGNTVGGFGASFTFVPVPEPSAFALGGLGAAALMIFLRRK